MSVVPLTKTLFPVLEVFGPVVQGEGPVAGQMTHFVRFGYCDYRCAWCDSMFAVIPSEVKQHARRLSTNQIMDELEDLGGAPWVTFSGGNPAIHRLGPLTQAVQDAGMWVVVETQGSIWNEWLGDVNTLVVSPKPPSSGMVNDRHRQQTELFMYHAEQALPPGERAIKIVVFDEEDLVWADEFMVRFPWPRLFLSVGTDPPVVGEPLDVTRRKVCERYRWLCEQLPRLSSEVTVFPQLHVLAYGHQRGV
jgi:7-carboxy-7-deazaguanine synthase